MDPNLLLLLSKISQSEGRQENAIQLARFLGAEELVLFILDTDTNAFLPILGFRQTFPEGLKLKAFLESCLQQGKSMSSIRFSTKSPAEQTVRGFLISEGFILVLAGGDPSPEKITDLCLLLPLIQFGYKCERELHHTSAKTKVLANAINESEAFGKALEQTRKQLESTVSELRKSEIKVRLSAEESQKALESLQQERDLREQFVATLTHDLRSPITAARMSAQIIMKKYNSDEHAYRMSARVVNSIDRVDHMIQNLLDANLIRAGEKLPLVLAECELKEMVKETLDDLTTTHGDRFVLDAKDEIKVFWSCSAIRRVIENLVNNGIKYGSPYRPVTITLNETEENRVRISVHNEGNPLSPEELIHIFEPYRRTNSAKTSAQKGWGLGLTLVKGIVEAHNGQTIVESSPEKGTTFSLVIPKSYPTI